MARPTILFDFTEKSRVGHCADLLIKKGTNHNMKANGKKPTAAGKSSFDLIDVNNRIGYNSDVLFTRRSTIYENIF